MYHNIMQIYSPSINTQKITSPTTDIQYLSHDHFQDDFRQVVLAYMSESHEINSQQSRLFSFTESNLNRMFDTLIKPTLPSGA